MFFQILLLLMMILKIVIIAMTKMLTIVVEAGEIGVEIVQKELISS